MTLAITPNVGTVRAWGLGEPAKEGRVRMAQDRRLSCSGVQGLEVMPRFREVFDAPLDVSLEED